MFNWPHSGDTVKNPYLCSYSSIIRGVAKTWNEFNKFLIYAYNLGGKFRIIDINTWEYYGRYEGRQAE